MAEVGDFGALEVSDVTNMYNVSTTAYVTTVYPQNGTMTVYVNETREVTDSEVRVAWVVILSILGAIFTCLSIVFILKACKKDDDEEGVGAVGESHETDNLLVN